MEQPMMSEQEREQVKTDFLSLASHQLRTPLTSIKLFVEMLSEDKASAFTERQRDYLSIIQASADRTIQLLEDFLAVIRIEMGLLEFHVKRIHAEDIVERVINGTHRQAEARQCTISVKKSNKRLPAVLIDPFLFRNVISVLLENAVFYSSKNPCEVTVALAREGAKIILSVHDNGIGIPPHLHPMVFSKFFRAPNALKAAPEGSGLGLYMAKKLVEMMGGSIWFTSEAGRGTTFFVALPAETS
jgi:signal transduction histidine kinase